jgi:hypothetical protein
MQSMELFSHKHTPVTSGNTFISDATHTFKQVSLELECN